MQQSLLLRLMLRFALGQVASWQREAQKAAACAAAHLHLLAQLPLTRSEPLHESHHICPEHCIIGQSLSILPIKSDQAAEGVPALGQQMPRQLQL